MTPSGSEQRSGVRVRREMHKMRTDGMLYLPLSDRERVIHVQFQYEDEVWVWIEERLA